MDDLGVGRANPYNAQGIIDIYTGLPRQWAYSPKFTGTKLIASAAVQLTGRRRQDYAAAEAATGVVHNPRRTVWHHVYDYNDPALGIGNCTMQLVTWADHLDTLPHAGGCKLYTAVNGGRYKVENPNSPAGCESLRELEALEAPECPRYSGRELDEFCLRTGLELSPTLRALYSGSRRLSRTGLQAAARQDFWLDAIFPLYTTDGSASMENVMLAVQGRIAAPMFKGARAVAGDACGDIFFADDIDNIWFYDHEQDSYLEVDADLRQLAE